jgi:hypothetical protein
MSVTSKTLIAAAKKGDLAGTRRLLRNDQEVNSRDDDGLTALIWAARKGHRKVVETLLVAGADANALDAAGQTALHHAVASKHRQVVHALVQGGADVNAKDRDDCTPFELATLADEYEIARELAELGAKDDPPDPGIISVGRSPGSTKHPPIEETIDLLSLRLAELPEHNAWGQKGQLRIIFHIPGPRRKVDFEGIRKAPYLKKKRILEVHIAVPITLTKKRPIEFLLNCMGKAVDLAEPVFQRAKVKFPAPAIREHLDAIGLMRNWEFPDFHA